MTHKKWSSTLKVNEHGHWYVTPEFSPLHLCLNDLANACYRKSGRASENAPVAIAPPTVGPNHFSNSRSMASHSDCAWLNAWVSSSRKSRASPSVLEGSGSPPTTFHSLRIYERKPSKRPSFLIEQANFESTLSRNLNLSC